MFHLPPAAIVGAQFFARRHNDVTDSCSGTRGAGYPIISGLARGIDTAAQEVFARDCCGSGRGLDPPYPRENATLCDEISSRGNLQVSGLRFGWEPRAKYFPRRSRIVAGASLGIVVVAARRSGSLISVNWPAK